MKPIGKNLASKLIDFTGGPARRGDNSAACKGDISETLAESQLDGSVAAYNMLARNGVAYIADEVGLGKTYVALGVMGLVRHFRPNARILVLAPKENIQRKWVRDFGNFVRENWRVVDNRVKSIQGRPARDPVVCDRLANFAREVSVNANRDFFLRMTSFSLALRHEESRNDYRKQMLPYVEWLAPALDTADAETFREQYGRALNALLPDIDLLVVDEAHNLRKGFGSPERSTSNRNRILGLMLGHPSAEGPEYSWYGQRIKRVLCLSATPFEQDYGDVWRQFDVLGKGGVRVRGLCEERAEPVEALASPEADDNTRRKLARDLLIRRITHLRINEKTHTKNMYRREWRHGGLEHPDQPICLTDPRERLIVALVQKKVAEVLGDEKFGNHFQIGMLSSFESFQQSVQNIKRKQEEDERDAEEGEGDHRTGERFDDGNQTQDPEERRGADTDALNALVRSYRDRFEEPLPHPKLDATVASLASAFKTGEKALIFVRRIATVGELAQRLDRKFDQWIELRMKKELPELHGEIDDLFERFRDETRAGDDPATASGEPPAQTASGGASPEVNNGAATGPKASDPPASHRDHRVPGGDLPEDSDVERATESDGLQPGVEDDPGGRENFFSWFFRGNGPDGVLSGAAFQKNRLSNTSAAYSTLFEDDLVSWLLERPDDPLKCFAERLGPTDGDPKGTLRRTAWAYYQERGKGTGRYPRYYVFEAYQAAGLYLLSKSGDSAEDTLAGRAGEVLRQRFPDHHGGSGNPPDGFPMPETAIGVTTFFTELKKNDCLRQEIWPKENDRDFAESFRRREERRELLSAMARLGGAYIDLYLLGIREIGSFTGTRRSEGADGSGRNLARRFVELLAAQAQDQRQTFNAYTEFQGAAAAFDTLVKVNFAEMADKKLHELASLFGRRLQWQNPVGRMSGGVAQRIVRQFRMPGFPLALISTDVLQEGEDLHTFCRRVIHYGITWTPSAMEQRTGRVDRIGGLAQRRLDGLRRDAEPEEKIQVLYPHLKDTVERLQVRRVLKRLNEFIRLVHEDVPRQPAQDSKMNANQEMLAGIEVPPPVGGSLKSAFPVQDVWLEGACDYSLIHEVDVEALEELLECYWRQLVEEFVEPSGQTDPREPQGIVWIRKQEIVPPGHGGTSSADDAANTRLQRIDLELRSAGIADVTFLRCSSVIGHVDLKDQPERSDRLRGLQVELRTPRLCARWDAKHKNHIFSIETSMPFGPAITQYEEVRDLVRRVALQADRIEEVMLKRDQDAQPGEGEQPAEERHEPRGTTEIRDHPQDDGQSATRLPKGLERVSTLLGEQHGMKWTGDDGGIVVDITVGGLEDGRAEDVGRPTSVRKQQVRVDRKDSEYVFSTVVLGVDSARPAASGKSTTNALALKAWERNAGTELVNYTIDTGDRLVGEIRHPVGHLDQGELLIYLQALATEGDRFEYVLSGRDEH